MILAYISENGSITNKEARELLELADSTTKRILKEMVKNEFISKHGEGRSRKYYLK